MPSQNQMVPKKQGKNYCNSSKPERAYMLNLSDIVKILDFVDRWHVFSTS
jgi:hypothetical protein